MEFSFESFHQGVFDYDPKTETHTCLWLREEKMDVGGGTISVKDIDKLKDYPKLKEFTLKAKICKGILYHDRRIYEKEDLPDHHCAAFNLHFDRLYREALLL